MNRPSTRIPTPYGVEIDGYHVPAGNGATKLCAAPAGMATWYGIHDRTARRRFVAAAERALAAGREDDIGALILRHGGWEPMTVAIGAPAVPVQPPKSGRRALDDWAARLAATSGWLERSRQLLATLAAQLAAGQRSRDPDAADLLASQVSRTLTALLERLGEREIACLEQAAFYALSLHPEWTSPARSWLLPIRNTWLRDWIAVRPDYRHAARLLATHQPIPDFLWRLPWRRPTPTVRKG